VEKGDIDIAWEILPDQINELKKNKDLRIESSPATIIYYVGMNVTKGPLKDNRVRTAIRHAIDYNGIIDSIMGGAARPTNSFIPKGFAGYEDIVYYREDLEKARKLLKEAGFPDGFDSGPLGTGLCGSPHQCPALCRLQGQAIVLAQCVLQ
jgi:peptide/nickel transport system substrate-binding protein